MGDPICPHCGYACDEQDFDYLRNFGCCETCYQDAEIEDEGSEDD